MSLIDIAAISLTELFGDINFKYFSRTGVISNFLGGIVGYIGVIFFLIKALMKGNVMYVNGMWDGMSAILNTIVLFLFFGERLINLYQYAGLGMVFIGVLMINWHGIAY